MLVGTFDVLYRRFCLARIRVRDAQYVSHLLSDPDGWQVTEGSAQLVARDDATADIREVRYNLPTPGDRLLIRYTPKSTLPVAADKIDRLYISWRADDSWSRVGYEVIRNGKRYRSLGDSDITFPVDSQAATIDEIIAELETTKTSERAGRAMDHEREDAFERLRATGYM